MSNIDKQAVQAVADLKAGYTLGHADVAILNELARIALASLEAEAVAFRSKLKPPSAIGSESWDYTDHRQPDAFELENCVIERLFTAPPAPVSVPDELTREEYKRRFMEDDDFDDTFRGGWNACRAAMLQGADGNSPVIPNGWVMVPVEPTSEMQSAAAGAIRFDTTPINKLWTGNAVYRAMLAAAPKQEVK